MGKKAGLFLGLTAVVLSGLACGGCIKEELKEAASVPTPTTIQTPAPAEFEISRLTIAPAEAKAGAEVKVSVDVKNVGGVVGLYNAILKIDGVKEAARDVTVEAGEAKTVTFTVARQVGRTYTVDVGGLTGTLLVLAGVPEIPYQKPHTPTKADTSPPTISALGIPGTTSFSATIAWATDEPSTGQVEYGFTASYTMVSPLDERLVTLHSITLKGLEPTTTYHFRVKSKDASGNEAVSGDNTVTTDTEELRFVPVPTPRTL